MNGIKKYLSDFMYVFLITLTFCVGVIILPEKVSAKAIVWDGSIAKEYAGGDGSVENPYQIANGAQLVFMIEYYRAHWNVPNYNYILTEDILLNDTSNWKQWGKTVPTNKWTTLVKFNGTLDGNGHIIAGLYTEEADLGLFSSIEDGVVKNLGIVQSYLKSSGAFAGRLSGGSIENCYSSAIITGNLRSVGGIVGENGGVIKDCYNLSDIIIPTGNYSYDAYFRVGGIAGVNFGSGTIIDCYNKGSLTAGGNKRKEGTRIYLLGGIVGENHYGKIDACTNYGVVYSKDKEALVGGIVGELRYGTITECINEGKIERGANGNSTGGIAGLMESGEVLSCSNKGAITVLGNSRNIGGIIGEQDIYNGIKSTIKNCNNAGKISAGKGSNKVGGIVGNSESSILNCVNKGSINVGKDSEYIGGIIGFTYESSIINCINVGNVTAPDSSNIGGVVGQLGVWLVMGENTAGIESKIVNCANIGNITGKLSARVAGIAGEAYDRIYNSYNTGDITGTYFTSSIVGLVGGLSGNMTPVNCYYRKGCVKTSKEEKTYGTALSLSQMKSSTLTKKLNTWVKKQGKKAYSTWVYKDNKTYKGYPYLKNVTFN